jgi:prolyl-tRNA synthetase
MSNSLPDKSKNLSEWYNQVVLKAKLADYAPVKGCMVIRPYGFSLWHKVQDYLGKLIADRGVLDAYFPLFIPESFLNKEKEHVKGFAPELAVVTIGGGKKLAEKLVVRPTSETIIYAMFQKWGQSYRDLPLMVNQWCNVVRWEKRTYMFLRTTEFLWQEGHCAHLTHAESQDQVQWALKAYQQTYNQLLAMYGIAGIKSESEKFAGAGETFTFECLMPNGKALQACTSHDLGQNFAKSFDWYVQDDQGKKVYPWQNSWGLSTRSIGGLIMVHGDNQGLVLPPLMAPIQVVIVPIPGHQSAKKLAQKIYSDLKADFRLDLDLDDSQTAGFKFNQSEIRGIPVRLEIGDKEAAVNQVIVYRRDTGQKTEVKISDLKKYLTDLLDQIQQDLLQKHQDFTLQNTRSVDTYDDFKKIMQTTRGFISAHWCGSPDCETAIKGDTKASIRCLPQGAKEEKGSCVYCGKSSTHRWLFAQSY